MKRFSIFIFALFICCSAFAVDLQADFFLGGFTNYTRVKGIATHEEYINYNYVDVVDEYKAKYNAAGFSFGFDMFRPPFPLGMYLRYGFIDVPEVERLAAGVNITRENTDFSYNMFYDFGSVIPIDFNQYVSLCVAPAASLLLLTSEYLSGSYTKASIDSIFGVGVTADIYIKARIKYFAASAGCAASYYPLALVNSADTAIKYRNVRNTEAYNIRPYISVGFSLIERTSTSILPAN